MDYVKLIVSSVIGGILVLAGAVVFFPHSPVGQFGTAVAANVTTIGNPWQFNNTVTHGTNGTALTELKNGTCTIFAYATTIAASTTAQVDCQAGAAALTAISGIQSGDRVFASVASTTVATFEGLTYQWVSASTTPGYITIKIYNGTGTTFTWAATASSSIPYVVYR